MLLDFWLWVKIQHLPIWSIIKQATMMRVLYPENPLHKAQADDPYQEELIAVNAAGYQCSLFDFDALAYGEFRPRPTIQVGDRVLYRGWMLTPQRYADLIVQIKSKGGEPVTSNDNYLRCHHLPGWYQQCTGFTAETQFFAADQLLESKVADLNWERYFVKDFVKSNTGKKGSIANSPAEVCAIVEEIIKYRGEIEGGVAIRRFEDYRASTERRYFVVKGIAYSATGEIPELVKKIAGIVDAPFYSVDVVENSAGGLRLVELGDGQVSDKKTWSISKFVDVITANASGDLEEPKLFRT
jgi:ATP-grasp domain, R2K clade family 3